LCPLVLKISLRRRYISKKNKVGTKRHTYSRM
jgi:hypothetical protein